MPLGTQAYMYIAVAPIEAHLYLSSEHFVTCTPPFSATPPGAATPEFQGLQATHPLQLSPYVSHHSCEELSLATTPFLQGAAKCGCFLEVHRVLVAMGTQYSCLFWGSPAPTEM